MPQVVELLIFKSLLPQGDVDAAFALLGESSLLSDEQKEVRCQEPRCRTSYAAALKRQAIKQMQTS